MPRKDNIHEAIKNALIKDGWTIIADPLIIAYDGNHNRLPTAYSGVSL
jgi:hypothetical protein